jgi:hypothetical protein
MMSTDLSRPGPGGLPGLTSGPGPGPIRLGLSSVPYGDSDGFQQASNLNAPRPFDRRSRTQSRHPGRDRDLPSTVTTPGRKLLVTSIESVAFKGSERRNVEVSYLPRVPVRVQGTLKYFSIFSVPKSAQTQTAGSCFRRFKTLRRRRVFATGKSPRP